MKMQERVALQPKSKQYFEIDGPFIDKDTTWTESKLLDDKGTKLSFVGTGIVNGSEDAREVSYKLMPFEEHKDDDVFKLRASMRVSGVHRDGSKRVAVAFKEYASAEDKHVTYCGDASWKDIENMNFAFCGYFASGSGQEAEACFAQAGQVGNQFSRWVVASPDFVASCLSKREGYNFTTAWAQRAHALDAAGP